jgi:hypothetical protein
MKLKVDTSGLRLVLVGGPDPVLDFGTKDPRTDEAGVPLFAVKVVALGEESPEVFTVKVPGEPQGVVLGSIVELRELIAQPWSIGDKSGVAFRAAGVVSAAVKSRNGVEAG